MAEVIYIYRAVSFALFQTALGHISIRMSHSLPVIFTGDKTYQIQSVTAQIAQCAGSGQLFLVSPRTGQIIGRTAAALQILHVNVINVA